MTETSNIRPRAGESGTGYELLDFMFTVAISFGLAPELFQTTHLKGVLSEDWIVRDVAPSSDDLFNLAVLGLGVLTITLSWVGYRESVAQRPLKTDTLWGQLRFTLDIVLVILYGFVLIRFKLFSEVLRTMCIIYVIYAIWDLIKMIEYRDQYPWNSGRIFEKRYVRNLIWILCAVVFFVLLKFSQGSAPIMQGLVLVLAYALTVFFRWLKLAIR
jgi:hypothetical protein